MAARHTALKEGIGGGTLSVQALSRAPADLNLFSGVPLPVRDWALALTETWLGQRGRRARRRSHAQDTRSGGCRRLLDPSVLT